MSEKIQHKVLANNKKAYFQYFVEQKLECGVVLHGTEVKSMKANKFNFVDSYAEIENGELWLNNLSITPYAFGNTFNHTTVRSRKLLAHKQEIAKLRKKVDEKGYTLVPLQFYIHKGLIKVEIGLCKGKKLYDKRDSIKQKDMQREQDRVNKYS
ncbi:SsrA-binding protein SmpB [Spirochaeta cellobiosiphila]|uniref:SsrA-binding protein SmpB n=1 Tax=Spirochaeta cellobiosiphila TaxID=504483 RepID=UPI000426ECBA|nr:SsrA-binding protein SmpB [Spirochaeta cellobiosiphila]